MDIARPLKSTRRILPRIVAALIGAAIVGVGAWGARSLRTGYAPTFAVDRAAVISDVVHRGDVIRSVPASGTLAARRVAVIAAPCDGVIAAVFVRPGSRVRAGTAIVQLSNPLTESKIADARAQIASARAELTSVRQQAVTARLEHEQALRATQAESASDRAQVSANRSLHEQGLIADLPYRQAVIKLAGERDRERLQQAEIVSIRADGEAKIAAAQAHVVQLQGLLARDIAERDALLVHAGIDGTVQSLPAQLGARATVGSELARVADQRDLEAKLAVVEGDARSVHPGLAVALMMASGNARGTVVRINPAANAGTVEVEVALDRIPANVRTDEHVQGQIELERLMNVLWVARPAAVADDTTAHVYRLTSPQRAELATVQFGSGSSDRITIRSGLHVGDGLIISDMSAAGDHAAVALR